jgi:purine-nucleoside/S-methyl-5'-thioadenosine phosphorylase / adenosine deaminase
MSTGVSELRELQITGDVPRFEIPGWRDRYGVVAGITGRGTVPGRGFDLGLWTDAPVGEVMSRWRAFRQAEPGFAGVILGAQVHQTRVLRHPPTSGWLQLDGVDGHATDAAGVLLTVTVADCIPVYLLDPVNRAVALLHSGWRGTAGGILAEGVRTLVEGYGSIVDDVLMHCGVGICGDCYEVGREVMEGCRLPVSGSGPWHVDLREVLVDQAQDIGVRTISTSQWCSGHHRDSFYSHRLSAGRDGRMVAYLGLSAARSADPRSTRPPRGADPH